MKELHIIQNWIYEVRGQNVMLDFYFSLALRSGNQKS